MSPPGYSGGTSVTSSTSPVYSLGTSSPLSSVFDWETHPTVPTQTKNIIISRFILFIQNNSKNSTNAYYTGFYKDIAFVVILYDTFHQR